MDKLSIIARFNIHQGKLEEFKFLADVCLELTREETGVLVYDWYIDDVTRNCTVIETYKNSAAVLAHNENINESLAQLMEISDFSAEVFGHTSTELTEALNQMNVKAIPYVMGL